jgi:hypothetical protein
MKTMTSQELQKNFPQIWGLVQQGEDILIHSDENKTVAAVIMSYAAYQQRTTRPLGMLQGKATCRIHEDFAMTDEELLNA